MAGVERFISFRSIEQYMVQLIGAARAFTPDEEDTVEASADQMLNHIIARTPVDTGQMASAWRFEIRGDPGEGFSVVFINEAPYAEWVHRRGDRSKDPVWDDLVDGAWAVFGPDLLARLRGQIAATESALNRGVDLFRTPINPAPTNASSTLIPLLRNLLTNAATGVL